MKKRMIVNIVIVTCAIAGIFFIVKYDVMGRLYNVISRQVAQNKSQSEKNNAQGELIYVTVLNKDGNYY